MTDSRPRFARCFLRSRLGFLVSFVFLVLAAAGLTVIAVVHFHPICGEDLILEKASQDGRYVAVLMSRNCGATTPYVAHINLRLASSQFKPDSFDNKGWGSVQEFAIRRYTLLLVQPSAIGDWVPGFEFWLKAVDLA